jgi:hypothetical protein
VSAGGVSTGGVVVAGLVVAGGSVTTAGSDGGVSVSADANAGMASTDAATTAPMAAAIPALRPHVRIVIPAPRPATVTVGTNWRERNVRRSGDIHGLRCAAEMPEHRHIRVPVLGKAAPPLGSDFVSLEAASGIVLLLAAVGALIWRTSTLPATRAGGAAN